MKCLSLTQPWAELLVTGEKKIETRSWGTRYRGLLAIQAAKTWTGHEQALLYTPPFREALARHARADTTHPSSNPPCLRASALALGAVVGVVELVDCIDMTDAWIKTVGEPERSFGGYALGRFGWVVRAPRRIPVPVLVRGRLGIFDLPLDVEHNVAHQLDELERAARCACSR